MTIRFCAALATALLLCACATLASDVAPPQSPSTEGNDSMQLGNFCVCLAVKDLGVSHAFYEKLGFTQVSGDAAQGWVVLKNGAARVGLFQGMLDANTLSFNPGWTADAEPLAQFEDVRELQARLQERGVALDVTADPASTGPAYFILKDPDGNPIFVDQHVPRPAK